MCPPGSARRSRYRYRNRPAARAVGSPRPGPARARDRLQAFLGNSLNDPNQRVLFTGAGSSGFIAEMVADAINAQWPAEVRVVHTTSLLTHPALYLQRDRPTLLVSFGRSGSSPESVAAVDRVRADVDEARFLDITCNADGELARRGAGRADTCTLLMPSASCDRAFAMTSSLTCMLLAALTVFDRSPWDARVARLKQIAALAREGRRSGMHRWRRWRSARSTASSTSAAARWKRWRASAR